nr:hypothetical protein BaRGS_003246 [Batillaria attramentaria]
MAGKILFIYKDWVQRCVRFVIWGVVWSLSFVVALSGMAFILLLVCYLLIDVYKVWSGAPFYYPGMNSIVLYVGHELLSGRFPVAFDVAKTHGAQLAMNLWGSCLWVIVAYYLYLKGIFISV